MAALQDFFASYETRPVSGECHKQLGLLLQQRPPAEVEQFLHAYRPTKLHLQLLRACAATTLGSKTLLLEGITSESKAVATFCARSPSLFSSKNSDLCEPGILLPLLRTVSYSTRNKVLSNLARHLTDGDVEIADRLFDAIVGVWGPGIARPLLCRTSEAVIRRELVNGPRLISFEILTIARRFPTLSVMLVEKVPLSNFSLKAVRVLVRNSLPESLSYCLKHSSYKLLSKTTMRRVLRKHSDVIMASPAEWAGILDIACVKKVMKPETFELFVLKQVESELKNSLYVSCYPPCYIQLLPPKAVSSIMNKLNWAAIEDFWESNESLLKLLETADRHRIASELFAKTKSLDWVALMTCDVSIPIIKDKLSSEADSKSRARLVVNLLTTVDVNKDQKAFEEVCEFVAVRYRNDKEVLNSLFIFFNDLPDLRLVDEKTWTLVYSLVVRFLASPSSNYASYFVGKIVSAALKRNGRAGLKIYIDRFFDQRTLTDADKDFTELAADLREECISLVFTSANIESEDNDRKDCLSTLLPVISKWNTNAVHPIHADNVNTFVLNNLELQCAVDFVVHKYNGLPIAFVEKCFETIGNPAFLKFMMQRNPERLAASRAAVDLMADYLIDQGCWKHIALLKSLKRKGYLKVLEYLCDKSLAAIRDPDHQSRRHAIILLSLTAADTNAYLQEARKFLVDMDVGQELAAPFLSNPEPTDCQDQEDILEQSLQKESIYKGIGNSFSFVDTPSVVVETLLKFCINGDLMLFVRDSVYSVSFSVPSVGTKDLLSHLVHKPVSVVKHAFRIHRMVSDVKAQREFLAERLEAEKHLTVRACLFEYALRSLHDTKSADIWQVVKEMMARLTPKDITLVTLLRGKTVPLIFWEQYVKLLLEKTESLENVTIEFVSSILSAICNCIASLPISAQFHEHLVKVYFLSDRYFVDPSAHESVCNLLVAYLAQKADGQGSSQSDVEHKRLLLSDTLDSVADRAAVVAYDALLGYHPTTRLLCQFVNVVCSSCQQQEEHGVEQSENNLSVFVDTLLAFFERLEENLLFGSFVSLSLTAITCGRGKDAAQSAGFLLGQFIDRVYARNAGLALCALPVFVEKYFAGRKFDACFFQDILLPPCKSHRPEALLARQVVVTKLLPSNWKKDKSLEAFRENYLLLVRNTPAEVILFADDG